MLTNRHYRSRSLLLETLYDRIAPAIITVTNTFDYPPYFQSGNPDTTPIPGSLRKAVSDARQSYISTQVTPTITFNTDASKGTPFGVQGPADVIELDHGVLGPEGEASAGGVVAKYSAIDFPLVMRGPRTVVAAD